MKKTGFFLQYRYILPALLKLLNENETVLYLLLVQEAGWDKRQKENYAIVFATIRELRKEINWSIGKLQVTLAGLENKGFVKRGRGKTLVHYLWIFEKGRKNIYEAEQFVHLPKLIVPTDEQLVRRQEQANVQRGRVNLAKKMTMFRPP